MSAAVTVSGLGKRYKIGAAHERATTLRDAITGAASAPIRRLRHAGSSTGHVSEFWALRDVSFEVEPGQVMGIIGRNGAGKSTLLKILSRITLPTTGQAVINGRVGSLLEVGTGFHQELSGRENISLNGAILGMSRSEIGSKFDEIVAFSEIGEFLDTPVKRYSSGMFVRLAFAVAAHLEPEVLIVDEVLAVGDVTFQRKCIGKMEDVAGEGRTVLFVSHNMHAVRSLCSRAVQLDGGRIVNEGPSGAVVDEYLRVKDQVGAVVSWAPHEAPGDAEVRLLGVAVLDADDSPAQVMNSDQAFRVRLELDVDRVDEALCVGFDMASGDGTIVFRSYHTDRAPELWPQVTPGRNTLECEVPAGLLNEGRFMILPRISIHKQRWIVHSDGVVSFEVHRVPTESPYTFTERPGPIAPVVPWSRVDPSC